MEDLSQSRFIYYEFNLRGARQIDTEALSCGVPVVCTSVEGVPEIVRDNETGILVPPKNPSALATGIIKALNDIDGARKMAEEGRKFVNKNFDVKKMVDDIDTLYDTLL